MVTTYSSSIRYCNFKNGSCSIRKTKSYIL